MKDLNSSVMFSSYESRQLYFKESCFKSTCKSSSLPTSYSATGLSYITRSSKDTALNLTSTRGFRGRLTLTEDILVELSILGPIPGLLFLAKKVVMEGTSQGFFLLVIA